jgi:hypothetical protein
MNSGLGEASREASPNRCDNKHSGKLDRYFPLYRTNAVGYRLPMTEIVEPKTEFRTLSETAVMAALEDADPKNAIAAEVARLITAYTTNFQRHVERVGYMPSDILRLKPRWPIEAVAMRLTTQAIRQAVEQAKQ